MGLGLGLRLGLNLISVESYEVEFNARNNFRVRIKLRVIAEKSKFKNTWLQI